MKLILSRMKWSMPSFEVCKSTASAKSLSQVYFVVESSRLSDLSLWVWSKWACSRTLSACVWLCVFHLCVCVCVLWMLMQCVKTEQEFVWYIHVCSVGYNFRVSACIRARPYLDICRGQEVQLYKFRFHLIFGFYIDSPALFFFLSSFFLVAFSKGKW